MSQPPRTAAPMPTRTADASPPAAPAFTLSRNPFGQLVLHDAGGQEHVGVTAVRAYPLSAPGTGLSIMGTDGHELAWVDDPAQLPAESRHLIEQALAQRDVMPVIQRIVQVASFATPSRWEIDTDRGRTSLTLKAEEDIRRLPGGALLITDAHGLHFSVTDVKALDKASRKILDRFMA